MNLFADVPAAVFEELHQTLHSDGKVRIMRIVSRGQASPPGFWYDQAEEEWVVVLQGAARLTCNDRVVELKPGDCLHIPAHQRHRVEWTTPDEPTIWLAVFYG